MRFPRKPARPDDKKPGPRDASNYRPRGRKRLGIYTWQDIADVLGLSVHTAKKYVTGKGRRFDPASLASVFAYALSRRA